MSLPIVIGIGKTQFQLNFGDHQVNNNLDKMVPRQGLFLFEYTMYFCNIIQAAETRLKTQVVKYGSV